MKQFLMLGAFMAGTLGLTVAQTIQSPARTQQYGISSNADTTIQLAANLNSPASGNEISGLFDKQNAAGPSAPRLNPRAVAFVDDYMEKYSKSLQDMKGWALPYFNMIDAVMIEYGLPRELKYLAVIESKMKAGATSWAGAVGPWQLMRETAIKLGLKVNKKVDERRNYVKSTHAAARYLKDLYAIYGDWLLVIASYNAGPGTVQRAISKSGSKNFWDLQYYLPSETRNHVKKFIGTHYIFEGGGGLTTLTKSETVAHYGQQLYAFNRKMTAEETSDARSQQVAGKYQSHIVARHVGMEMEDFNRYNPDFDKVMAASANGYELKLPAGKMDTFNANKYQILQESVQFLLSGSAASTL
ncbi:lytic transglycosylase domain-containing protein [Flavihumibacter petaseus]|uniref:Putative transglycosylase n=1 Tax=Flavihumibacter petaseus NBRC 106054 TaxID=1220578 RepID=A0A0E9N4X3_9BACT|nr:lytic transglycosylase domain-containing protein [Flavihumibacter petaseus]GAO45012.1 putative transglycosylase [Flavihumibacter petaseus NBRC 106054]